MLENVDLSKRMKKKDYSLIKEEYELKLSSLQREAKKLGIPIIILFEGWGASGKGTLINKFIHPLDPRGFNVYSTKVSNSEEKYYPFLPCNIHILNYSCQLQILLNNLFLFQTYLSLCF